MRGTADVADRPFFLSGVFAGCTGTLIIPLSVVSDFPVSSCSFCYIFGSPPKRDTYKYQSFTCTFLARVFNKRPNTSAEVREFYWFGRGARAAEYGFRVVRLSRAVRVRSFVARALPPPPPRCQQRRRRRRLQRATSVVFPRTLFDSSASDTAAAPSTSFITVIVDAGAGRPG